MELIELGAWELGLSVVALLSLVVLSALLRLGVASTLLVAALRATLQLGVLGLVLRLIFSEGDLLWVAVIACIMLLAAGYEVRARQERVLAGGWAYGIGIASMFVSSLILAVITLLVILRPAPWYTPQYSIPLLGMLLGNTMSGISLAQDRFVQGVQQNRLLIEARLLLGQTRRQAFGDEIRRAVRTGLMPIINAMAAAGLVSLPGMMTGQILAGTEPMLAARYQLLILFLITVGTGLGTSMAVLLSYRRLTDKRGRVRLERVVALNKGISR